MLLASRYCWTPAMKGISNQSLFLFLASLTCCTWAWPAVAPAYRRTSNANYIPFNSNVAYEPDYQLPLDSYNYNNDGQWDRAREPSAYYTDLLDDYWMNQPASEADIEAVADLYDPPAWGKIVKEKPETELEELKAEEREREEEVRQRALENQYKHIKYEYNQEKRAPGLKSPVAAAAKITTTTIQPITKASTTAKHIGDAVITPTQKSLRVQHTQQGMKEVPLLRPPNKGKMSGEQHQNKNHEEESEPGIAVGQRSAVGKPSAYDTLRKYLSLEDALKQEAEKRQSSSSRLQKRAPAAGKKQFVTDVESLGGQLSNLKKSMV